MRMELASTAYKHTANLAVMYVVMSARSCCDHVQHNSVVQIDRQTDRQPASKHTTGQCLFGSNNIQRMSAKFHTQLNELIVGLLCVHQQEISNLHKLTDTHRHTHTHVHMAA